MEELQARIAQLEETLTIEREEFKKFYRTHKSTQFTQSTQSQQSQQNGQNEYVDEEYFKESQYIHSLKKQIDSLIQQNNALRAKNLKLTQELESFTNPEDIL